MYSSERRHLTINDQLTTVSLEPVFWLSIERLAATSERPWPDWVTDQLLCAPAGIGRASWLRQAAILEIARKVPT